MTQSRNSVSDEELKRVIADFLDQGHVENIVAMFRREPSYYAWTGDILRDERFSVRLGISVLFEELQQIQPEKLALAIPSLAQLLTADEPLLRGEAVSLLGIIGNQAAMELVRSQADDPDPQVREMVQLVLRECLSVPPAWPSFPGTRKSDP
jgi:predicted component of type VI protein secretion system